MPTVSKDVEAYQVSRIDTAAYGGSTLRIGDLNNDGAPDLLVVQSIHGTREITCLTAVTLTGEQLWQYGEPDADNSVTYSDLPVQVYDWNGDGVNEVLWVKQATYASVLDRTLWYRERATRYEGNAELIVLDAATGAEKHRLSLPAPADDSLLFADLTGRGRRQDLVVKDRYWNMWGVSHEGEVLWQWAGSTGHYAAVADIDGDGCDEVFVGYALLDHDGRVLWENPCAKEHSDCNVLIQLPDGQWRLLFGNGGVHCLDVEGRELWHQKVHECQHLVAGQFCPELGPVQFMAVDRGSWRMPREGRATLLLYDLEGNELWRREQEAGSWCANIIELDWSGSGEKRELALTPRDAALPIVIYDGRGEIVQSFAPTASLDTPFDKHRTPCIAAADVWGDSREELIVYDSQSITIFANRAARGVPSLYNSTHYRGM